MEKAAGVRGSKLSARSKSSLMALLVLALTLSTFDIFDMDIVTANGAQCKGGRGRSTHLALWGWISHCCDGQLQGHQARYGLKPLHHRVVEFIGVHCEEHHKLDTCGCGRWDVPFPFCVLHWVASTAS